MIIAQDTEEVIHPEVWKGSLISEIDDSHSVLGLSFCSFKNSDLKTIPKTCPQV